MRKVKCILEVLLVMIVLQLLLSGMKLIFGTITGEELFTRKMITMSSMAMLTIVVLLYGKWRNLTVPVVPHPFTRRYVIVTILAALILFTTPSNFTGNATGLLLLLYGSIVTPIFEELLFRGVVWSMLEQVFETETKVFLIDAVLFSLWHLGYVVSNLLGGDLFAVLTKMAVGLVYGILLGAVRVKINNCYGTMLLHGVLNAFL